MRRLVILAVVGLLAMTSANAQTSGSEALDAIDDLVLLDANQLLLPEGNRFVSTIGIGGPFGTFFSATAEPVFTSLEATGSFGGILNTNDYAYNNEADLALLTGDESNRAQRTPSEDGDGRARVIFTNLTNYAGSSTGFSFSDGEAGIFIPGGASLQLGTVSKVGPGNLAVGFAYRAFNNEITQTTDVTAGTPFTNVDSLSAESSAIDLSLAYGFHLGEAINLGFSLRTASASSELTEIDSIGGVITSTDNVELKKSNLAFAGAFRMDMSESLSWNVRAAVMTSSPEFTFADAANIGTAAFTTDQGTLELSGMGFGLLGRVNFFGEQSDNEVFIGFSNTSYDLDTASFTEFDVAALTDEETWKDDITRTDITVGWRGFYRLGKADFTPALIFDNISYEAKVQTMQVFPSVTPPFTSDASQDVTISRLSIPFSARYHFTEKFSLGAGARWVWNVFEDEFMTIPGSSFPDPTRTTTKFELTSTFAEYRLFMRYGNETLSGQLLFAGSGSFDSRTALIEGNESDKSLDRSFVNLDTVAVMVNVSF